MRHTYISAQRIFCRISTIRSPFFSLSFSPFHIMCFMCPLYMSMEPIYVYGVCKHSSSFARFAPSFARAAAALPHSPGRAAYFSTSDGNGNGGGFAARLAWRWWSISNRLPVLVAGLCECARVCMVCIATIWYAVHIQSGAAQEMEGKPSQIIISNNLSVCYAKHKTILLASWKFFRSGPIDGCVPFARLPLSAVMPALSGSLFGRIWFHFAVVLRSRFPFSSHPYRTRSAHSLCVCLVSIWRASRSGTLRAHILCSASLTLLLPIFNCSPFPLCLCAQPTAGAHTLYTPGLSGSQM